MMLSGANHLYNNKQLINDLNVFPVPDGDTGTNMSMTVNAMAKSLEEIVSTSVSKVADTMSFATLRGARGNSGVILSQFFRGIARALKGKSKIDAADFANALQMGSDAAYKAVMNPTEGTILTVAREIARAAVKEAEISNDVARVLDNALKHGGRVLLKTPDMLPALKKAGVVDAGGQGWLCLLEGALYYLENGECVIANKELESSDQGPGHTDAQKTIDISSIKYMYCTEFIIEKNNARADVLAFKRAIGTRGDSMLVIDDEEIVKVHIHTNNPGYVLEHAVKLGSMINIKIDNMKQQHQSLIMSRDVKQPEKEFPKKEIAFVAVCAGEGLSEILGSLGVDLMIEGGQTMNPSTDDILQAVKKVNADHVFVFPNNKNIILAAEQAKKLAQNHIIVLPTKNIPQCVAAMLVYKENRSIEENEAKMNKAMTDIKVGQITYAVRDTEMDGVNISEGDVLGLCEGKIALTGKDFNEVCKALTEIIVDEDSEFLTLYYGADVTGQQAEEIGARLEEKYPDLDITVKFGGQPLYYYILSVE